MVINREQNDCGFWIFRDLMINLPKPSVTLDCITDQKSGFSVDFAMEKSSSLRQDLKYSVGIAVSSHWIFKGHFRRWKNPWKTAFLIAEKLLINYWDISMKIQEIFKIQFVYSQNWGFSLSRHFWLKMSLLYAESDHWLPSGSGTWFASMKS